MATVCRAVESVVWIRYYCTCIHLQNTKALLILSSCLFFFQDSLNSWCMMSHGKWWCWGSAPCYTKTTASHHFCRFKSCHIYSNRCFSKGPLSTLYSHHICDNFCDATWCVVMPETAVWLQPCLMCSICQLQQVWPYTNSPLSCLINSGRTAAVWIFFVFHTILGLSLLRPLCTMCLCNSQEICSFRNTHTGTNNHVMVIVTEITFCHIHTWAWTEAPDFVHSTAATCLTHSWN